MFSGDSFPLSYFIWSEAQKRFKSVVFIFATLCTQLIASATTVFVANEKCTSVPVIPVLEEAAENNKFLGKRSFNQLKYISHLTFLIFLYYSDIILARMER